MQIKPGLLILILRVLKSHAAADVLYAVARSIYPTSQGNCIGEPCRKMGYQENEERKYSWKVGSAKKYKTNVWDYIIYISKLFTNFIKVRSLDAKTIRRGACFYLRDSLMFNVEAM
jgi:hypothetical protein